MGPVFSGCYSITASVCLFPKTPNSLRGSYKKFPFFWGVSFSVLKLLFFSLSKDREKREVEIFKRNCRALFREDQCCCSLFEELVCHFFVVEGLGVQMGGGELAQGLWNELSVALSLWVAMQVESSAAGVLRIETHVFLMSSSNGMNGFFFPLPLISFLLNPVCLSCKPAFSKPSHETSTTTQPFCCLWEIQD